MALPMLGVAVSVVRLAQDPNGYLSAVQLGITLAGFLASATSAVSISEPVADLFGGGRYARPAAVVLVTILLSLVTLVFGELVPKGTVALADRGGGRRGSWDEFFSC